MTIVAFRNLFFDEAAAARTMLHKVRKLGAGSENRTRTLLPEPDFEVGSQRFKQY
jgi:hypothetical protein